MRKFRLENGVCTLPDEVREFLLRVDDAKMINEAVN